MDSLPFIPPIILNIVIFSLLLILLLPVLLFIVLLIFPHIHTMRGITGGSVVKNLPADAEDAGGMGSIPWVGKIPWRGNSYPLQYSCPENSIDRGVWQATANGVVESDSTFTFFNHAQVVKTQGKNAQRPPPWSSVLTGAAGHV